MCYVSSGPVTDLSPISELRMEDKDTEYATQFFGFIPESFADVLNEESNDLISDALEAMKQKLVSKFDKVTQTDIETCMGAVEDKYLLEVDNIFEKLSSSLSSGVLAVPHHVLLDEDEAWDDVKPSEAITRLANTNASMEELRDKIKTASYKKMMLSRSLVTIQDITNKQQENIKEYEEHLKSFNVSDWKVNVDLTMEKERNLSKRIEAIPTDVDLSPEDESLFSYKQQNINSKNCARILEELKKKYSLAETGN